MHNDIIPELPAFLKREKQTKPAPVKRRARRATEPAADTRPRLFLERKLSGRGIGPGWHTYEIISAGRKWVRARVSGKPVKISRKAWDTLTG